MGAEVDPEIAEAVAAAVQVFVELGATVEAAEPAGRTRPMRSSSSTWSVGAATLLSDFREEQKAMIDPGLRKIARGRGGDAVDRLHPRHRGPRPGWASR